MKKTLSILLLMGIMLSLAGCGGTAAPASTEATQQVQVEDTAAPVLPAEEETAATEPVLEQDLFLTVSSITFSVAGESENIYLGLIPADQVSWESENPEIVSVENGVLTAVSAGTTVIHASYYDKEVSCTAGCLAQTQEELEALDSEILSAPKRLPPEVDLEAPCTYFDDAALIGDSITYFLWQLECQNNYLGEAQFLTRMGVSVNSLARQYKSVCFEGIEMDVEEAIARSNVKRAYFLLGCLDFQVPAEKANLINNWNVMMDRITEKLPDLEIVIISSIPCYPDLTDAAEFNQAVADANVQLRQMAEERDFGFLDLYSYIEDHTGSMSADYSKDTYHMDADGSLVWMKVLRYYTQFEAEGGSLWNTAS